MKWVWGKYYNRLCNRENIPRWAKIKIVGYKCSKTEIRRKIKLYRQGKGEPCCPDCGCDITNSVDHHVEYPEIWINHYCMRCGKKVAYQDNSPYIHVLDGDDWRGDDWCI